MMEDTDQNVITLPHRCDEHQLCITMLSGTKTTDQMAMMFRLGKSLAIWTVWERLTRRTCELAEITEDCSLNNTRFFCCVYLQHGWGLGGLFVECISPVRSNDIAQMCRMNTCKCLRDAM